MLRTLKHSIDLSCAAGNELSVVNDDDQFTQTYAKTKIISHLQQLTTQYNRRKKNAH